MPRLVDMTGKKYGRLTAIKRIESSLDVRPVWLFQCECGNTHIARGADVRSGKIKSCGCLNREKAIGKLPLMHAAATTHGQSRTSIYKIWYGMKGRCYTKSNTCYPRYGAKGITVCKEWLDDPEAFIKWALANGYKKGLSIDRIDGTKGYSPDNCRFITQSEQMRNISCNVKITRNGATKILADWAKETGIHRDTIEARLKRGLTPEEAMQ